VQLASVVGGFDRRLYSRATDNIQFWYDKHRHVSNWRNLQGRDDSFYGRWNVFVRHDHSRKLLRPIMRRHSGFTLIELIASIVVLGIISAAGAPVLVRSVQAYNSTLNTVTTLDKLRYATDRIAREIRESTYNSSTSTSSLNMSTTAPSFTKVDYLISGTTISSTTYTVLVSTSGSNVNISYTPSGGSDTVAVLTDQLSSLQFAYYDNAGTSTTLATAVHYVEIRLTLTANGQSYSSRTRVALRNI
jgi:MSHA biogenesis protein MshO